MGAGRGTVRGLEFDDGKILNPIFASTGSPASATSCPGRGGPARPQGHHLRGCRRDADLRLAIGAALGNAIFDDYRASASARCRSCRTGCRRRTMDINRRIAELIASGAAFRCRAGWCAEGFTPRETGVKAGHRGRGADRRHAGVAGPWTCRAQARGAEACRTGASRRVRAGPCRRQRGAGGADLRLLNAPAGGPHCVQGRRGLSNT